MLFHSHVNSLFRRKMLIILNDAAMNPIQDCQSPSLFLSIHNQPVIFQPVWLPLLIFCGHADLLPQAAGLKHQQAARVRPGDHPIRREPGVTQEVELFHLGEAALLQGSLGVAEQLEHPKPTDAKLRVVEGVEADLNGPGRKKSHFTPILKRRDSVKGCFSRKWRNPHLVDHLVREVGGYGGQDPVFLPEPQHEQALRRS